MSFWESRLGALLGLLLLVGVTLVALSGVRVFQATHPPRELGGEVDLDLLSVRADDIRFPSADGIDLAGWLLEGEPGRPPLVLCHDLGTSKDSLLSLAISLNVQGYTVLLFDFRGHGRSGGTSSTLGLAEKRDVLGALDFLARRRGSEPARVGVYAVGMGAHAAVLAAADRPTLRVLVLDGLYPDASFPLARKVFAGWRPAMRHLSFFSSGWFALMNGMRIGENRAADRVGGLLGRDLLFLAPEGDPELVAAMQRMVQTIPDQPDVDGNLVVLPATQAAGLYGVEVERHRQRVASFFDERLGAPAVALNRGR